MKKGAKINEEPEGFPRKLLEQPKAKWLEYFRSYGADHPAINDARNKLMRFALGDSSKMLAFVIGPTGAGKTFLRECLEDDLNTMAAADATWNQGRIPSVSVDVPGKDTLKPSWSDLYVRLLRLLYEPESLIGKKIIHGDLALKFDTQGHLSFGTGATTRKYRYALEQALKHRNPFVVNYEEAQHLLDFAGLSFQELMDCVKSIADMTKIRHALYGNYEMQVLLDQSDQLMRRSVIIHVRRYSTSNADQQDFRSTIYNFQLNMPLHEMPNLLKHSDYLYERTAGCVGILSDWLSGAYTQALNEAKVPTLTLYHLEENVPFSSERAYKMLQRINNDEKEFLREFNDEASVVSHVKEVGGEINKDSLDEGTLPKPNRRNSKVGERAPTRDVNGTGKRHAA
jgi:hypothetical protein